MFYDRNKVVHEAHATIASERFGSIPAARRLIHWDISTGAVSERRSGRRACRAATQLALVIERRRKTPAGTNHLNWLPSAE